MSDTRPVVPPEAGTNPNSPLSSLIRSAFLRIGNFSPNRIDAEMMNLMLQYANEVLQDIRTHPYWTDDDPAVPNVLIYDYLHQTDIRPVPDLIIIMGMKAKHLKDQGSEKAGVAYQEYHSVLNGELYNRMFDGTPRHNIIPMDGGSGNG